MAYITTLEQWNDGTMEHAGRLELYIDGWNALERWNTLEHAGTLFLLLLSMIGLFYFRKMHLSTYILTNFVLDKKKLAAGITD